MQVNRVKKTSLLEPMGELLPRCQLCDQVPLRGIASGFWVNRRLICDSCEQVIMNLEIGSRDYTEFMQRLRKIWK